MAGIRPALLLLWLLISLALVPPAWSRGSASSVEKEIAGLIKGTSDYSDETVIKVEKLPPQLRAGGSIDGIDIVRPPNGGRPGLAIVEYRGSGDKRQSSYVAFQAQTKKRLFYVKRNMTRGECIEQTDVYMKESYTGERNYQYPESIAAMQGKLLRRDVQAGTLITNSLLEERQTVKRGQTVTLVAQNRRLMVQTFGRAVQPGKRGDLIKVRSLTSERELQGRILDSGTVAVDF